MSTLIKVIGGIIILGGLGFGGYYLVEHAKKSAGKLPSGTFRKDGKNYPWMVFLRDGAYYANVREAGAGPGGFPIVTERGPFDSAAAAKEGAIAYIKEL